MRTQLHAWFQEQQRPLPWRTEPSLYRTVVSEFMCQQTQVATALPYFERWILRFPDFTALANAPEEQVLTAWSGLGYYARARNLQRLAQALIALPEPPRTPEAWIKLPGVGPYTAAAICSIAFNHPAAVVDGNVVRVITRLLALEQEFPDTASALRSVRPTAERLLDPDRPGLHNEALMELGATVCSKHRPACLLCPWRDSCAARRLGLAETLPRFRRRNTEKLSIVRAWIIRGDAILLERQGAASRRLARLVELPRADRLPLTAPSDFQLVATRQRSIGNQRITEQLCEPRQLTDLDAWLENRPELFWHPLSALAELPLSGPHRRWIEEISAASPPA